MKEKTMNRQHKKTKLSLNTEKLRGLSELELRAIGGYEVIPTHNPWPLPVLLILS